MLIEDLRGNVGGLEGLLMPMEGLQGEDDESLSSSTELMGFISAVTMTCWGSDSTGVFSLFFRISISVAFS